MSWPSFTKLITRRVMIAKNDTMVVSYINKQAGTLSYFLFLFQFTIHLLLCRLTQEIVIQYFAAGRLSVSAASACQHAMAPVSGGVDPSLLVGTLL